MTEFALPGLLRDFWQDLQAPGIFWQAVILSVCLVAGKLVERVVRGHSIEEGHPALSMGHRGLKRVVFPLVSMLLLAVFTGLLHKRMHINLLLLALPLLGSLAGIRCVFYVLRLTFSNSAWLASFERVFATLVWCVVAVHISGLLPDLIDALEAVNFTVGKQRLHLWQLLQGVFAVAVALLVSLWLGTLIEARIQRNTAIDPNLQVVFARLGRAAMVVLAVMITLPSVGIDLTALSVFGGAIGVGLGFGLQKIASNYVSGFIILLERSIRIGNVISVGGEKGQVTEITTRYTVLRNGNGVESLVPNEALVVNAVQNETYSDHRVRHAVTLQINYRSSPEKAIQLMVDAAASHPDVAQSTPPQAFVELLGEFGINLQLQYWLENQSVSAQRVRSDIQLAILQGFSSAGVDIAVPHQEARVARGVLT